MSHSQVLAMCVGTSILFHRRRSTIEDRRVFLASYIPRLRKECPMAVFSAECEMAAQKLNFEDFIEVHCTPVCWYRYLYKVSACKPALPVVNHKTVLPV